MFIVPRFVIVNDGLKVYLKLKHSFITLFSTNCFFNLVKLPTSSFTFFIFDTRFCRGDLRIGQKFWNITLNDDKMKASFCKRVTQAAMKSFISNYFRFNENEFGFYFISWCLDDCALPRLTFAGVFFRSFTIFSQRRQSLLVMTWHFCSVVSGKGSES